MSTSDKMGVILQMPMLLTFETFGPARNHNKGPVKLIEWVKMALLFLHVTSKLIQSTILNLSG